MKNGGKRKGAGRPKGTIAKSTATALEMRQRLVAEINKHLSPLIEAKLDLALGYYEAFTNAEGEVVRAYRKAPDNMAIQYLLNQAIGKPKETMDMTVTPIIVDPKDREAANKALAAFLHGGNRKDSTKQ